MCVAGDPGGSDSEEPACNAGDPGYDPWVGEIPPGKGMAMHSCIDMYSCLENSIFNCCQKV